MIRYLIVTLLLAHTIGAHAFDRDVEKMEKVELYYSEKKLETIPWILYQLKFKSDSLMSRVEDAAKEFIGLESSGWYLYFTNDTVALCSGPCADTLCTGVHQLGYIMVNGKPLVVISEILSPEYLSFEDATDPRDFPFYASYDSINGSLAPTKCIIVSEGSKHNN